jgi:FkbM family methyltransferase
MPESQFHQSYSIEGEDLIIQRLLDAVVFKDPSRTGFFMDVGAFHPINHSNTYLLYRKGWRGVNVEPNPQYINDFLRERPEDVTLNVGLSDQSGKLTYHLFDEAMLNGFLPSSLVDYHVSQGRRHLGEVPVDCLSVRDFLDRYATRDIDVLNLDIETYEPAVLRAWDWNARRPKLICVEIHALSVTDVMKSEITDILANQGYLLMSRVFQSAMFIDSKVLTP